MSIPYTLYQTQCLDDHVLVAKGSSIIPRGIYLFLTFSDTAFTFAFSECLIRLLFHELEHQATRVSRC